jgi:hypothetical protein
VDEMAIRHQKNHSPARAGLPQHLVPAERNLKLPELKTVSDAQSALSAIFAGAACGAILLDEASTLASIISSFVRTTEVAELETGLCALEKASAPPEGRYDA